MPQGFDGYHGTFVIADAPNMLIDIKKCYFHLFICGKVCYSEKCIYLCTELGR